MSEEIKLLSHQVLAFLNFEQSKLIENNYEYILGDSNVFTDPTSEVKSTLDIKIINKITRKLDLINLIIYTDSNKNLYLNVDSTLPNWPKSSIKLGTFEEFNGDLFISYLNLYEINKLTYNNYYMGYVYKEEKYEYNGKPVINGNKLVLIEFIEMVPVVKGTIYFELSENDYFIKDISIFSDDFFKCTNCNSNIKLKYYEYIDSVTNDNSFNDPNYDADDVFITLKCPLCHECSSFSVNEFPNIIKIYNINNTARDQIVYLEKKKNGEQLGFDDILLNTKSNKN